MDAWQAALEDVGPAGLDGVKGGKYGRAGCSSRSTNTLTAARLSLDQGAIYR
jgi:hypothetical protein